MTFILMFGFFWSFLAAVAFGGVILYRWSRGKYKQAKGNAEARKKEELRLWAHKQLESRPEDEETWHQNQEMKMR